MQFYILMVDYGPNYIGKVGPSGLEAIVQPELTRLNIVEEVANIRARDRNKVVFVKFVDGNYIEDVTVEIVDEAYSLEAA